MKNIQKPNVCDFENSEKYAIAILNYYNIPIVEKYDGSKYFWHMYHMGDIIWCCITYSNYISRIITIYETKPEWQHKERLKLLKPVKYNLTKDQFDNEKFVRKIHKKECKHCSYNFKDKKIRKFEFSEKPTFFHLFLDKLITIFIEEINF